MPTYQAFGLRIETEMAFSGLAPASRGAATDPDREREPIRIGWGDPGDPAAVAPVDAEGWYEFGERTHRFGWAEVGVVAITAAKDVKLWPRRDVARGLIEHVLFGPVLADIVLWRGQLPLHASANRVDGGVVAFIGKSGQGKSTLAAAMHALGCSVHGDDLLAVPCSQDVLVPSGISRIKLNRDSLRAANWERSELPTVYEGIDKLASPVSLLDDGPQRLLAIYRVVDSESNEIVPIESAKAIFELLPNCFRIEVEQHAFGLPEILRRCAAVSERVPLFELRRPRDLKRLGELAARVEAHARGIGCSVNPAVFSAY